MPYKVSAIARTQIQRQVHCFFKNLIPLLPHTRPQFYPYNAIHTQIHQISPTTTALQGKFSTSTIFILEINKGDGKTKHSTLNNT